MDGLGVQTHAYASEWPLGFEIGPKSGRIATLESANGKSYEPEPVRGGGTNALKGMVDLSLAQVIMPLAGMLSQARTWRLSNRNSHISPLDRLSTFLTGI